ncbi:MAG TPA: hypothetical protein VGX94_01510 [Terriglobia bacterium]|nr:hypothetical protein [Terriglobia bacterium]
MRVCERSSLRLGVFLVILFAAAPAFGQAGQSPSTMPAPVRDPQAVVLLSQVLSRLKSTPTAITDVSLTASATYTAGSDQETGTATLQALGAEQSRVTLNLDNGQRQEIRNGFMGAWSGTDGAAHPMAGHNCWADASWFYPLLTLENAAADPTLSVAFAGPTTINGEAVEELVLSRVMPNQSATVTAEIQKLSTVHFYLDSSSLLPVEIEFNTHPDKNFYQDIPLDVEFSDYRPVSGVLVPFHIQKFIQHSLLLDLEVSGAAVNSGLSAGEFALPAIPAATGGQQ